MIMKTNLISLILAIAGIGLSIYHFANGYGVGDHLYVGLVGAMCIVAAVGVHRFFNPTK